MSLSFLPLSDHCKKTSLGLADIDPALGIRAPSPSGIHLSTVNLANRRTSKGMDILCLVRYGEILGENGHRKAHKRCHVNSFCPFLGFLSLPIYARTAGKKRKVDTVKERVRVINRM